MKVIEDGKPGFFAMASAPGVSEMEFLIKRSDGAAGDLMDAKEGSEVFMSAPMGKGFSIASAPAEDYPTLLLFAAGTGISPLRALLESGAASGRSDVRLYYGVKDEDTMAYIDKFGEWADAGVEVVQCFSDPKGVDALNKGYVQVRVLTLDAADRIYLRSSCIGFCICLLCSSRLCQLRERMLFHLCSPGHLSGW